MKYTNGQVIDFINLIDAKTEYFSSESDKALLRSYNECDDFMLTDKLISSIWNDLKKYFFQLSSFAQETPVTIMHTNSGTGRVLELAKKNVMITAYNNDYMCRKISDLLNQANGINYNYVSEVFDISQFFIGGDNGNTKKYDIVFTQLMQSSKFHIGIDGTDIGALPSLDYYPCRSLDFITKKGYLCVLASSLDFFKIKNNPMLLSKADLVSEITSENKYEFSCLIFKKK